MNGETEAGVENEQIVDTASPEATSAETTSQTRKYRSAQLIRAGVLVVVGIAIAFTAPLHSEISFDRAVIGASLALIGAATMLEYRAMAGTAEAWWIAARAIVAFAAAGSLFAVVDSLTLALVVALWGVLTGVITVMRLARKVQPPRIALPSMILSVVLAVTALVAREDPVAVIGFFGAYAIIRGVFLAISALDTAHPVADPALAGAPDTE